MCETLDEMHAAQLAALLEKMKRGQGKTRKAN